MKTIVNVMSGARIKTQKCPQRKGIPSLEDVCLGCSP